MEQILSDIEIIIHRTGAMSNRKRQAVHICSRCKGEIYEGERYLDFDGEIICPECVDEMRAREVFELFGYYFSRAWS
ncbi:MAG: hypothetical protein E7408_03105 [Ruminococcaceae bacterium]|nr:hypothetical protein [Oscillospiraceae bacterium]